MVCVGCDHYTAAAAAAYFMCEIASPDVVSTAHCAPLLLLLPPTDGDEEQDTTPDLDLPVIRPLSNDDDTNDLPPSVKRKIVPHSPFDMDVTLSPASSLPDLYEFDGMRTPDELDDSALHDADVDYPGHMLSGSMFGPDLDWEGEIVFVFIHN